MLKVQDTRQITDLQMCSAPPPPLSRPKNFNNSNCDRPPTLFVLFFHSLIVRCEMHYDKPYYKKFPHLGDRFTQTFHNWAFGIWLKSLQVSRKLTISAWGVAIPLYYPFDVI